MKKLTQILAVGVLFLFASCVTAGGYARSLGVFRAPAPACGGTAAFAGDCGGYVQQQVLAAPVLQQSYAVQTLAAPVYGYGGAALFRQRGFFRSPRFFAPGFAGGSRFFFRGRGFAFGLGRSF